MKRRDLIRHLLDHGCEFRREGGRHTIYFNPVIRQNGAVPRHSEIETPVVRGICRDLGIPAPGGAARDDSVE